MISSLSRKTSTSFQSICSGSASIVYTCWDSGYTSESIIIPAGIRVQVNLRRFDFLFRVLDLKSLILSRARRLVTLSGGCGLTRNDGHCTAAGKVIINIRKLRVNLRLLRRRENAVQRTPPRAHSAGADYTVLNWNADLGTFQRSRAGQCTTYRSRAFSESTRISNLNRDISFSLNASFSIGFGNGLSENARAASDTVI